MDNVRSKISDNSTEEEYFCSNHGDGLVVKTWD
jgi:hypothetical protein